MIQKDIAYERRRTRDLLLEYDSTIMPPRPRAAGLSVIYPWENLNLSIFAQQLFAMAANSGFEGTEQDFKEQFGSYLQGKQVIYEIYDNFPIIGEDNKLYFDLNDKILYYWDQDYYPVNALLIENTILDSGNAPEESGD